MNISGEDLSSLQPINIPYTVCETLIGILAILGNGIVIIVFRCDKKLRKTSNYFIISLAFADFLLGLIGIPFAILVSNISSLKSFCNFILYFWTKLRLKLDSQEIYAFVCLQFLH